MEPNLSVQDAVSNAMRIFNEEYGAKFALTENRVNVWNHMLKDFNPQTIMAAAYHLATVMKVFPPEIATMRETVILMSGGKLSEQTAIEAWERVLMKIKGKDVELSDMESAALNQTGTMYDLKLSRNHHSDRARFIQAFDGLLKRRYEETMTMPEVKAHVLAMAPRQLEAPESVEVPKFEPEPDNYDGDHLSKDTRDALEASKKQLAAIVAGTGK